MLCNAILQNWYKLATCAKYNYLLYFAMKGGTTMTDELITVGEARAILRVSTRKMAELIKSGKLTVERDELDGRIKLVSRTAVEALAARSKRAA
jgi:hypothetical protein